MFWMWSSRMLLYFRLQFEDGVGKVGIILHQNLAAVGINMDFILMNLFSLDGSTEFNWANAVKIFQVMGKV